ncbi:MAG: rRNA pseudouridine synthase [Deltaproteobacteria bacterium]|jgi:pseudouridine synthase|nr:rRNA pseudouridine synthase [Deltaproteobacteria bacterium]MDA8306870.1 pseudouridine synthase [Deltaproteobacteria bacterium]
MPEQQAAGLMRLQKFLAQAGVASRRAAEQLIRQGRVEVNGRPAELGSSVDPSKDHVFVDGKAIAVRSNRVLIAFNKPAGCVTTASDPQGRKTVMDFFPDLATRIFPVGRLDYDAEGLLLLTNDGELANRLLHPRYGISKVYDVKIKGHPDKKALEELRSGVRIEEGVTAPAEVELIRLLPGSAWLRITLHQGWNRQIKRMGLAVGYPVLKIRRIAYGPISLGRLPTGGHRALSPDEIRKIYEEAKL